MFPVGWYTSLVQSRFQRGVVTLVLAICIVCPAIEMFDHWDHTLQTGQDTEYAFVVLALCAGASLTFARALLSLIEPSFSKGTTASDHRLDDSSWDFFTFAVEVPIF